MTTDATEPELGPTGAFPEGDLGEGDHGAITLAVGITPAVGTGTLQVSVDFGVNVRWLGLSPDQADAIAAVLTDRAAEVRRMVAARSS